MQKENLDIIPDNSQSFDLGDFWQKFAKDEARLYRRQGLKYLFKRKHFHDELLEMSIFKRAFYWLKTLICLLLWRTHGSYLNTDGYCITFWDMRPSCGEYSGYDWKACWVEGGVFKNWKVCLSSDSSY